MGETSHKDAFDFQLTMIKNEFNSLQDSINDLNTIMQSVKNWTITVWSGSLGLLLIKSQNDMRRYIIFTAIIPLLFWFVDAVWRRKQRRMIFRTNLISRFLNSEDFQKSFKQRKLVNFEVIDITCYKKKDLLECNEFAKLSKCMKFNSIKLFYCGLILISLLLGVFFLLQSP